MTKKHNSLIFKLIRLLIKLLLLPITILFSICKRYFSKYRLKHNIRKFYSVLSLKRNNGTKLDSYGNSITKEWDNEIKYFIKNTCNLSFKKEYPKFINKYLNKLEKSKNIQNTSNISPVEYESYICLKLKTLGFKAQTTKASGDQGVDVLAEKNNIKFAIQCKLYSSPVGNKAVQEVCAGRDFYDADYGIVVTNNTYTPAAKKLANKNEIILLNDRELEKLLKYCE